MSENTREHKRRRMTRYYLKVSLRKGEEYVPAVLCPQTRDGVEYLEGNPICMWAYIRGGDDFINVCIPIGDPWKLTPFVLAMKRGTHIKGWAADLKSLLEKLLGDLIEVEIAHV